MKPLPRSFYSSNPNELAVNLLGKVLVGTKSSGRIIETEAYGGENDIASHGSRGMTPRNEVMFGPPGHLYVYFTYGMHYCANVTASQDGECAAVLLRALVPLTGISTMKRLRPKAKKLNDLCSGPAKLTQALGIGKKHNGLDLCQKPPKIFGIYDDGFKLDSGFKTSSRIGVSAGQDLLWRYFIPGDPNLSRKERQQPK